MWFSDDGRTKPVPKAKNKDAPVPSPSEYLCLIRAYVTGKEKKKISTIVSYNISTQLPFLWSRVGWLVNFENLNKIPLRLKNCL